MDGKPSFSVGLEQAPLSQQDRIKLLRERKEITTILEEETRVRRGTAMLQDRYLRGSVASCSEKLKISVAVQKRSLLVLLAVTEP